MRELNLTDAQFELTLGILAEIDLQPVVAAFRSKLSLADLLDLLPMLAQAREKKIFRRLEAIWGATPDQLELAEADPNQMEILVRQAGKVPVKDTLEGFAAFFGSLGLSLSGSQGFSQAMAMEMLTRLNETEGATGSGPADRSEMPPSGD